MGAFLLLLIPRVLVAREVARYVMKLDSDMGLRLSLAANIFSLLGAPLILGLTMVVNVMLSESFDTWLTDLESETPFIAQALGIGLLFLAFLCIVIGLEYFAAILFFKHEMCPQVTRALMWRWVWLSNICSTLVILLFAGGFYIVPVGFAVVESHFGSR